MKTAEEISKERGSVYGPFDEVSEVSQGIEHLIIGGSKRTRFTAVQREAIKMVSSKLARLACGDPNHLDSWLDASNYLKLAHDDTLKRVNPKRDGQEAKPMEAVDSEWVPYRPPKCFGSNPSPQDQAENDCHTCRWRQECLLHADAPASP